MLTTMTMTTTECDAFDIIHAQSMDRIHELRQQSQWELNYTLTYIFGKQNTSVLSLCLSNGPRVTPLIIPERLQWLLLWHNNWNINATFHINCLSRKINHTNVKMYRIIGRTSAATRIWARVKPLSLSLWTVTIFRTFQNRKVKRIRYSTRNDLIFQAIKPSQPNSKKNLLKREKCWFTVSGQF